MRQIISIAENFKVEGKWVSAELLQSGHIHTTYLVKTQSNNGVRNFILQQVNQRVFPQPEGLANNIGLVLNHLQQQAILNQQDPAKFQLTMQPTRQGYFLHRDHSGEIWRMFDYIDHTATYQSVQNGNQVFQAGLAIGEFLNAMADFPVEDLIETIPDFHHTPTRFENFLSALKADHLGRSQHAKPEIDFVLQRQPLTNKLVDLLAEGELPLRVTHNDTKISNVLFDQQSGDSICLIDLDTVMPGTCLYDFGDAARTMTNTTTEDQPDLSLVDFNLTILNNLAVVSSREWGTA